MTALLMYQNKLFLRTSHGSITALDIYRAKTSGETVLETIIQINCGNKTIFGSQQRSKIVSKVITER